MRRPGRAGSVGKAHVTLSSVENIIAIPIFSDGLNGAGIGTNTGFCEAKGSDGCALGQGDQISLFLLLVNPIITLVATDKFSGRMRPW